ncbi:MAG: hypothetical protein M1816_006416 [Peltula sp. TS41687]|nr:MAG: hypothetical protein M1816_006416 [Peltula sp. TS41687]
MKTFKRSFEPAKPSLLRFSAGPSSPSSPLTPPMSRAVDQTEQFEAQPRAPPHISPPAEPLPWIWQCHSCRRTYRLGVTRRCLTDGHYFCMGTKTYKNGKTRIRACASEFDYERWSARKQWREQIAKTDGLKLRNKDRDCWLHCTYPSECRWTELRQAQSRRNAFEIAGSQPPREPEPTTVDDTERMSVDAKIPIEQGTATLSADSQITPPSSVTDREDEPTTYVEAVNPPTSPLKQHYQLPTIDEEDAKFVVTNTITGNVITTTITDAAGVSHDVSTTFIGQSTDGAAAATPPTIPTSTTPSHLADPITAGQSVLSRAAKIVSLMGSGFQRNDMI